MAGARASPLRLTICLLTILASATSLAGMGASDPEPIVVDQGWGLRWGDSPLDEQGHPTWASQWESAGWQPTEQIANPPGYEEHENIWLRTRLPAWPGRDPSLYMHSVDTVFEVYLDDEEIYGFGELDEQGRGSFSGWPWHVIPLPADFAGKRLAFRIHSDVGDLGIVGEVVLASAAHHVITILRRDLDQVILAALLLFVAVLAGIFGVLWRERKSAFSLGIFALLLSIWAFSETEIKQLVLDAPLFWTGLGLSCLYLSPPSLLILVEQTYGIGFRIALRILRYAFITFAVVALGLSASGVILIPATIRPFNLLVVVGLVVGVASLVRAGLKNNPEARIFTFGMLMMGGFSLYDVTSTLSGWRPPVTPWGLLLFVLCLCWILRTRFVAVHRRSVRDGLTGLANRYQFDALLDLEWKRAQREGRPLSLIMADLDHFKLYNDNYGHPEGDVCLKKVADTLRSVTRRADDVVARFGGEEFAVLLPGMNELGARQIAERMRVALERQEIAHESSSVASFVTISAGVATQVPEQENKPQDLVDRADKALYRAKEEGRNRICPQAATGDDS